MPYDPPYPDFYDNCYVSPVSELRLKNHTFETRNCTLTHLRPHGGNLIYVENQREMNDISTCETFDAPALYGGPIYTHFGHFLAESIHRLYALFAFPELKDATVFFHGVVKYGIQPWMYEVFDILGVRQSAVRLIDRPYHFTRLYAPAQARGLTSANFIEDYTKHFPVLSTEQPKRAGMIYMSRTKCDHAGGMILGEKALENALRLSGVTVIYPEIIGLKKTIEAIRSSECVVFSEGSSIHNVEAAGFQECKVFMIGRRPGNRARFSDVLSAYFREIKIYDELKSFFSLDFVSERISGKGATIIDIHQCLSEISSFSGMKISAPSDEILTSYMKEDILRFLSNKSVIVGQPTPEQEQARRSKIMSDPYVQQIMSDTHPMFQSVDS